MGQAEGNEARPTAAKAQRHKACSNEGHKVMNCAQQEQALDSNGKLNAHLSQEQRCCTGHF